MERTCVVALLLSHMYYTKRGVGKIDYDRVVLDDLPVLEVLSTSSSFDVGSSCSLLLPCFLSDVRSTLYDDFGTAEFHCWGFCAVIWLFLIPVVLKRLSGDVGLAVWKYSMATILNSGVSWR